MASMNRRARRGEYHPRLRAGARYWHDADVYAMSRLDKAIDVLLGWGIPQKPRPPFNYLLTFNIAGLTNEYAEPASS